MPSGPLAERAPCATRHTDPISCRPTWRAIRSAWRLNRSSLAKCSWSRRAASWGQGVLGDILLSRVVKRGGAAFVVDGAVRDAGEIRQFEIPVFVRGVHGAAHWRELMPVEHDGPIRCAGCTVAPGDWIVCDEHGVAVVPANLASEVAAEGAANDLKEEFVRELIEGGASTIDVYPPDEATLQGFPAWKAARGRR